MELKALCKYLDDLLISTSEKMTDCCPNGLQVEGKGQIKKAVTAVSASIKTIEKAVEMGADALIVHHGIFWDRDSYVIQGVKKKKIALLLEHGISLIAYHLPLDMHKEYGNNWKAAIEMKWGNLKPFGYFGGIPIGVQGTIEECSQEELKKRLENYYEHPASCAFGGPTKIKSLALISGGAYKSISEAAVAKVDAFITGNFDEPVWHQAYEEKINFFALGHSATERVGPRALAEHLSEKFTIPFTFIDVINPF
ncbi:MAG: Nif3-like dinuclear metal center hexameric protein [Parachlamydiaceae bacterium]|nr:Nif3-like dinuclear metal center hexameric protein [Parachlamydiaceae bacterium]